MEAHDAFILQTIKQTSVLNPRVMKKEEEALPQEVGGSLNQQNRELVKP